MFLIVSSDSLIAPYHPETLVLRGRHSYEIEANWKLVSENYHECYHCPLIHPEICQVSNPSSGDNHSLPGAWVGYLSTFAYMIAFYQTYTFIGDHVRQTHGAGAWLGGTISLAYGIGFGVGWLAAVAAAGLDVAAAQAVLDAIAADASPVTLTPFKKINAATADAPAMNLPSKWTVETSNSKPLRPAKYT